MKKVAFYTLGCKLNFAETSTIGRQLEERGLQKVDFTDKADIYVINTCSVTDHADKKCRKVVKEALRHSPGAFIAIIGCYAQLKPAEIAEIPGVDVVLGAAEKFQLPDLLPTFQKTGTTQIHASSISEANTFHNAHSFGDRTRAFLKVQDGCDYSCTFCTIPQARGNSRSNTITNVVKEAHALGEAGVKEIVLTGVNIGDFGIDATGQRKERFFDLVKALDQVESIDRFRISSIEPNLLSEEIIDFVASSERFMPHFHIPLQSGSNKILKQMRRRYLRELYAERIAAIKKAMPHCCIGVDVIVGFPGETDQDFLETYHFLNDLDISYLHVFPYSERANTPAATMPQAVPGNKRHERTTQLRSLSEKKKRAFYLQNEGKTARVLFEADITNNHIEGFTDNYVRVAMLYDPMLVNELKTMQLTSLDTSGIMRAEEVPAFALH